tara:strand:+ start:1286 stop:1981 length:696 start_codon:yes stop_codon:yes gene_type:complete
MKKNKIFVACDTSNLTLIKNILKNIKTNKLEIIPKFGLQFFYSKTGRKFLEKFNNNFFLDLKINDIKQTALSAIDSIKDLKKCRYITVHANGGLEMLKAVKKKAAETNKNLKVLGVTVLTSLNNKSLREIGHTKTLNELVLAQIVLIKKAGLHGAILSAKEAKIVKKKYKNLFIVTPGIRLPGDKTDDQARVVTPYEALKKSKVNAIVMGRSLTRGNITNNIKKLVDHLNQ